MFEEIITGFLIGTGTIMLFTFFAIWESRSEKAEKRHGKNNL